MSGIMDDFKLLAHYYMSLMEGDTHKIEDAMELLREYNFIDEDGEVISDEDDD